MLPNETGGVMMGYWSNAFECVITNIIGPGPKATHERFSFKPDSDFHTKEIAKVYNASGRIETYLGDWHTHPDSSSYLSSTDEKTLKKISNHKPSRLAKALMLILGTDPEECCIWAIEDTQRLLKKRRIVKCEVIFYYETFTPRPTTQTL